MHKVERQKKTSRNKNNDEDYVSFTRYSPLERRTSARLSNKPPTHTAADLKDEVLI